MGPPNKLSEIVPPKYEATPTSVRIPLDLLKQIDEIARRQGKKRGPVIVDLLWFAIKETAKLSR